MKSTICLLVGIAWLASSGCTGKFANYFLPTEPEAQQAYIKKPAKKTPPYTSAQAQNAVLEATVREFWQDASRSIGSEMKELYIGLGPDHTDPDGDLIDRMSSRSNPVRPLSASKRPVAQTNGANPGAIPPGRVFLAIESVDFSDPYSSVVNCQWSLGEGTSRTFVYQFQYASGKWSLIR